MTELLLIGIVFLWLSISEKLDSFVAVGAGKIAGFGSKKAKPPPLATALLAKYKII